MTDTRKLKDYIASLEHSMAYEIIWLEQYWAHKIITQIPVIKAVVDHYDEPWQPIEEAAIDGLRLTRGIDTVDQSRVYALTQFADNGAMVHLTKTGRDYLALEYLKLEL